MKRAYSKELAPMRTGGKNAEDRKTVRSHVIKGVTICIA